MPDELVKQSDYTPEGQYPRSRYVLRMTDGDRDWEVEFPEVASGYEIRIPLQGEPNILGAKAQGTPLTAAELEMISKGNWSNHAWLPSPSPLIGSTTSLIGSGLYMNLFCLRLSLIPWIRSSVRLLQPSWILCDFLHSP